MQCWLRFGQRAVCVEGWRGVGDHGQDAVLALKNGCVADGVPQFGHALAVDDMGHSVQPRHEGLCVQGHNCLMQQYLSAAVSFHVHVLRYQMVLGRPEMAVLLIFSAGYVTDIGAHCYRQLEGIWAESYVRRGMNGQEWMVSLLERLLLVWGQQKQKLQLGFAAGACYAMAVLVQYTSYAIEPYAWFGAVALA